MSSLQQKIRNWSVAFAAVLLCATPALAASIRLTQFNGNQATVVGQGFENDARQRSFQVNVYVNGAFVEDLNTNANGSFSYTTRSGAVSSGDRLTVKVLNWHGNGSHYEDSFVLESRRDDPRDPPPPPPFDMSDAEIRDYANQQARTVANRVTATFGELENWKYNFAVGYWISLNAFPETEHSPYYRQGESWGRNRGASDGREAGLSHGASMAYGQGTATATGRFREIVNTGREPNLSVPAVTAPNFGGLGTDAAVCARAAGRMESLEAELANEMRELRWRDDDFVLTYDAYTELYSLRLRDIYAWGPDRYDFVDSWAREEYAWDEWHNNRLRGRYDHHNYNRLQAHRQAYFRERFKDVYDSVIDEKYHRVRTRLNARARARGEWYGMEVAQKRNEERGCKDGYQAEYPAASIAGFRSGFTQSQFNAGFASSVAHHQNHALVTIGGIRLVDQNENGVFELGEAVGIVVGNVENLGRQDARNLPIQVSGTGLQPLAHGNTVTIAKSTRQTVNQVAKGLARVQLDVIADQANAVVVRIGESSHPLSYTVSWDSAFRGLAGADPNEAGARALIAFVLKNIQDEYTKTEAADNNIYGTKDGIQPSKLRALVDFYQTLPANQRAAIQSMRERIVAMQETHVHNRWKTGTLRKNFKALAEQLK